MHLPDGLRGLPMLRLHFGLRAAEPLRLAGYAGSTWHGALGHALLALAPASAELLYGSESVGDVPRPMVLLPYASGPEHAPGAGLGFSLTLFGPAVEHAAVVALAVEHLAERGLGTRHARLRLMQASVELADGTLQPWLGPAGVAAAVPAPVTAAEVAALWSGWPARRAVLAFDTRLRLKHASGLLRSAPPARVLLQRLLERVSALCLHYGAGLPLPEDLVRAVLAVAESVAVEGQGLRWQEWERLSGRTGMRMPFGGLVGRLAMRGNLAPLLPWLGLGEWLHLGSKSSFGLGHYTLLAAPR
ncbi:MAG: CRISPR system precrRNA processing endoribonuclease RAMP protein Cas6 [Pseudomonadota bacterium]